ncbi:MAG: septum formation initiator family protein [Candidatus Omnitrophica bacterium]|nr:septum formation initiator family protein [Candidatus Omnitrophota bacterium]MDE2009294.1 septum formation initiator family protein [Candidatus Omnitrophota bacterium]MDE2213813.1 septum formation initiator family protein [Candidatus Omnitrophota bacterium]MDE2232323.1 septum formation initiator family protein [Candidatus Omnitrophota bacterium]
MLKNALSLFILTVIILALFLPSYFTLQGLKRKDREYEHRISALEKQNKKFEEERHLLQTNPEYVEKVGRETMGLIRPGETVYKIIPVQSKQ